LIIANVALLLMSTTAFTVHTMAAREYYVANAVSLRIVAETAVRAGVEYLPGQPTAAMRTVQRLTELRGVAPSEIVLTKVATDEQQITLCLRRKVPSSTAFMTVGLPSREIRVTASARINRHDNQPAE